MVSTYSRELGPLLSRAFTSGVETTIAELALMLGFEDEGTLDAAVGAADFVRNLDLEFVPPIENGEYRTPRVLRSSGGSSAMEALRIMEAGEGFSAEFKSSLLCSMRDSERDGTLVELPSLPGEVLKTICAFLNSEGGDLLVGVDDRGNPSGGLRKDLEVRGWTLDDWQLHLTSLIQSRFREGSLIARYVDLRILEIGDAQIAHIRVVPRDTRSFVQREKGKPYEYFIRNASRSDSLDLPAFYEHLVARSTVEVSGIQTPS